MNFPHWDYLAAIDRDLDVTSRYIDFAEFNMDVYSTELTRIYLAVCSEIDVVARQLTRKIDSDAKSWGIDDYRNVIPARYPNFCEFAVKVRRLGSSLTPWKDWTVSNPQWWKSYNDVKHHRHVHYAQGNLRNVLHAACGLYVLIFYFHQEAFREQKLDPAMTALTLDKSLGGRRRFSYGYRIPDFPDMK
jgi:hypothetical protein